MTLEVKSSQKEQKLRYPKAVFFIISNEFCNRFAYYGMRTILALYIRNKLGFSDDTSMVIFHTFIMLMYTFPLFGAIIADSVLGKFETILYFSIVYALGQLIISASAIPSFGLSMRVLAMIGLFLMAMGAGGIKPCSSALGGDQFVLPDQEKYLAIFFSVLYFTTSAGDLMAAFLTPELRSGIQCFGDQDCYSVAFLVPLVLMIVGTVAFVMAKPLYRRKKEEKNILLDVMKCISHAINNKWKSPRGQQRNHWLDHADDKFDGKFIGDVKGVLRIFKMLIPTPVFWALYDQQGSRWTFQASKMDGEIGNYLVKSDQVQIVKSLLLMILIPIFEICIYPLFAKTKLLNTHLKKMTAGGLLAAVAFVISALVELKLETTYPVLPTSGLAQVRIFNPRDCHLPIVINNQSLVIEPFGIWQDTSIPVEGNQSVPYIANFSRCPGGGQSEGVITAVEGQATSYVLGPSTPYSYRDYVNKTSSGNPAIRMLSYNLLDPNVTTKVELSGVNYAFETNDRASDIWQITPVGELNSGTYRVRVNGIFVDSIVLKSGGVYTLQTYVTANGTKVGLTTVTPPNSVHILWLLPQYILIITGEILFAIPGVQFTFSQAPCSMKSILQAVWLVTVTFGNLIVVIIAEANIFESQVWEFFLFAGFMAVDMLIFAVMAKFYEYKNVNDDSQTTRHKESDIALQETPDHDKTG